MTANKACITRLQKEYKALLKEPVPNITAHPSSNLLEWHFVLEGAEGTDFAGGVYHGKLVFPPQYPFKPPSISLFTPNGRFAVNTKLCLSMTDYHPESWNPMWSVGTILTGLLSFMVDAQVTTGSITTSAAEKAALARASLGYNVKNVNFRKLFPEWAEAHEARVAGAAKPAAGGTDAAAAGAATGAARGEGQKGRGRGAADGAGAQPRGGAAGTTAAPAARQSGEGGGGLPSGVTLAVVVIVLAIAVAPLVTGKGWVLLSGSGS